jgi:hypothetical protein
MKFIYRTLKNIDEALEKIAYDEEHVATASQFLTALKETQPGERENVSLAIVEP